MATSAPDPVEKWAPIFTGSSLTDAQILNPSYMVSGIAGKLYCKLCDAPLPADETTDKHVRRHTRELKAWREAKSKAAAREARRLRELAAREKKLEKKVLDGN